MNPFQTAPENKKRLTLIGLFLTMFSSLMVSGGNSTILPTIAADIGGMEIYPIANVISAPLGLAAMPLWGYLGARDPSIKRLLISLSVFAGFVTILIRAFATDMWAVVIAGILWGLLAAGLYVLGFSMVRDMYDTKKAGIFLGFLGTFQMLGMLIGPFLTGIVIDLAGWRMVCHIIWPLLLLASILLFSGVKVTKEEAKPLAANLGKFDLSGAVFLIIFLMLTILGLSTGTSVIPFGSLASNVMIIIAVISLIATIFIIKSKGNAAIIPISVIGDRNVLFLTLTNFSLNLANMAVFFFIPSYMIYILQTPATQAGLATTMMSILGVIISPILGRAIAKAGNARTILTAGTIVRIIVTLLFLFFLNPGSSVIFIFAVMFVAGFYSSQTGVTFSTAPQIQVKQEIRQQGNSVIQIGQNFGSALGLSIYTLIIGSYGLVDGMRISFIFSVCCSVAALFLGLCLQKLKAPEEPAA